MGYFVGDTKTSEYLALLRRPEEITLLVRIKILFGYKPHVPWDGAFTAKWTHVALDGTKTPIDHPSNKRPETE